MTDNSFIAREREKFEAWWLKEDRLLHWLLRQPPHFQYCSFVEREWSGWLAAKREVTVTDEMVERAAEVVVNMSVDDWDTLHERDRNHWRSVMKKALTAALQPGEE